MNSKKEHECLEKNFIAFFEGKGYDQIDQVGITSKVDPSVYLINSATNLFKPFFSEQEVKIFAIQKSMRTQILKDYYQAENETQYPTCFESYGVYTSLNYISDIIEDSIEFFLSIGFNMKKMRVRACAKEKNILNAVEGSSMKGSMFLDDCEQKYYHRYGDGRYGYAVKLDYYQEWQQKYKNLAYFIIIYDGSHPVGIEMATSDQLILIRLKNLKYAISVAKITDILPTETFEQRRFADSLVGVANLFYGGIHPNSSDTNGRTLKKYLKAVDFFGEKLGIKKNETVDLICGYIRSEYSCEPEKAIIAKYIL